MNTNPILAAVETEIERLTMMRARIVEALPALQGLTEPHVCHFDALIQFHNRGGVDVAREAAKALGGEWTVDEHDRTKWISRGHFGQIVIHNADPTAEKKEKRAELVQLS